MDLTQIRVSDITFGERMINLEGATRIFHDRPDYGLVFLLSGRMYFEQNEDSLEINTGEIMMIPQGITYTLLFKETTQFYVINFSTCERIPIQHFHRFNVQLSQNFLVPLNRLNMLRAFKKTAWKLESLQVLYKLLTLLCKNASQEYVSSNTYTLIRPSIEYLEANFDAPDINNAQLARVSKLSISYFRKLFTERYGVSPMRYVQQKRMEKAKLLLLEASSTVEEIAFSVGYNSQEHFSRLFKQETGFSPIRYLQTMLDSNPNSMYQTVLEQLNAKQKSDLQKSI